MNRLHRALLIFAILLGSVACDQVTKVAATDNLAGRPAVSMLGGLFRLQYAENTGAMLSLGAELSEAARAWIFQGGVFVMLLAVLIFAVVSKELDRRQIVALSLVVGGGVGNLIDRVFNDGAVVDFMILGVDGLRTGVFNVADVAIMAGAALIALSALRPAPPPSSSSPPQELTS